MILVRNLRLEPGEKPGKGPAEDTAEGPAEGPAEAVAALRGKCAKKLRIPENEITELRLTKKSLDARRKSDIHYTCSAAVSVEGREDRVIERARSADVSRYEASEYIIPTVRGDDRPVIVGFGPAGMFAALVLAMAGARPIVLERGQDALSRRAAVEAFRRGGELDPESNVQFGEGGAGTFSDGKLNTGTHDRRMAWMLREFYLHGAPESVTYDAKPHIGTDILIDVVQSIRRDVTALGGEVRFGARLTGLITENGAVSGVEYTSGGTRETLAAGRVILAIGHSARDTYEALHEQGIAMEQKPFSMGVRIEHRQSDIDMAQYGRPRGALPPADYSLNVRLPDGESAYTFCMCPGGKVFAAASEPESVVTNGMSYSARDGENANAALLVTLRTEDFPGEGPLAGMYWQREIERRAYSYTGSYKAPCQLVGDFLAHRPSTGPGSVTPSYEPGVQWGELHEVLPEKLTGVLELALPELGKKLRGFDAADAVLTAPETRSSSPVRIIRDELLQGSVRGLYPCGEGAGYAGGISSAAVDGMRCAEAVLRDMKEQI